MNDFVIVDQTTKIPFDEYLFSVIENADKSLLLKDISYSDLIKNQNFLRDYFKNQYPKIRLSYNDNVSLFAFMVIYDKHKQDVESWKDVGDIFYKAVSDGFKFGINNDFNLYHSQRVCMCSNHSPANYFCYSIDATYQLIAGSICVKKDKIIDKGIVNRMKRDKKAHDKELKDKKIYNEFIDTITHHNIYKRMNIIGRYKIFSEVSNKAKNKLIKSYKINIK